MNESAEHPPAEESGSYRQPALIGEQLLSITDICLDGNTQTRVGLNAEAVADYAEEMSRDGAETFPPIDVFLDEENTHWLGDGFHRVTAAQVVHAEKIKARVYRGNRCDALVHNARANRKNGVTRTNADKRRSIELFLAEPDFYGRSDRWLAQLCFVGNQMVGDVRRQFDKTRNIQLCESHSSPPAKRIGRDGKHRASTSAKRNTRKVRPAKTVGPLPDTGTSHPAAGVPGDSVDLATTVENQPQIVIFGDNSPEAIQAEEDQLSPQQVTLDEHASHVDTNAQPLGIVSSKFPATPGKGTLEGLIGIDGIQLPPDHWDDGLISSEWVQEQIRTLVGNNDNAATERQRSVVVLRAVQTVLIELVRTANRVVCNPEVSATDPLPVLNEAFVQLRNYTNPRCVGR